MTVSQAGAPPWLYWLDRYKTDQDILDAATQRVLPLENLASLSPDIACDELAKAWEQVFIPGPQHVQLLHIWMHRAQRYARSRFPTLDSFKRLFDEGDGNKDWLESSYSIHCLTGLAGVSKSSLTKAFQRMFCADGNGRYETRSESFMLRPVRRVEVRDLVSSGDVLKDLANPLFLAGVKRPSQKQLTDHVRAWFQASATSMLIQDEMQFLTQSSTASTRTAQSIMTLGGLCVPYLYVANYSLIRKLMTRPHEERDRLLSHVTDLEPPGVDSFWWKSVIQGYIEVSPQSFAINPESCAGELHLFTRGIFRILRNLLVQSYALAREEGAVVVTMQTVRKAYKGKNFASHRVDVEALASISASAWKSEKRLDLVCPMTEDIGWESARRVITPNPASSPQLNIASAMVESTLNQGEKRLLREIRKQAASSVQEGISDEFPKAKIRQSPHPKISTEEALWAGAKLFQEEMKKSKQRKTSKLGIVSSQD